MAVSWLWVRDLFEIIFVGGPCKACYLVGSCLVLEMNSKLCFWWLWVFMKVQRSGDEGDCRARDRANRSSFHEHKIVVSPYTTLRTCSGKSVSMVVVLSFRAAPNLTRLRNQPKEILRRWFIPITSSNRRHFKVVSRNGDPHCFIQ